METQIKVKALYDYEGLEEGELSLVEGGIYKAEKTKEAWWEAEDQTGKKGYIPSNYVEIMGKDGEEKENLKEEIAEDNKVNEKIEEEEGRKRCANCNEILSESYVRGNGKGYHQRCFNCSDCGVTLSGKGYIPKDGMVYCEQCHKKAFNPKCSFCDGMIDGPYIKALEKSWHPDHFNCSDCGKGFDESYHINEEHPYCKECFKRNFVPKCAVCDEAIEKTYLTIGGMKIHQDCFKCEEDGKVMHLDSEFKQHDGKIYCLSHYKKKFMKKCFGCENPIEGKFLNILGKDYHEECFKCDICSESIANDDFIKLEGKFVCRKHKDDVVNVEKMGENVEKEKTDKKMDKKIDEKMDKKIDKKIDKKDKKMDENVEKEEKMDKKMDEKEKTDKKIDKNVEKIKNGAEIELEGFEIQRGDMEEGDTLNSLKKKKEEEDSRIFTYKFLKDPNCIQKVKLDYSKRDAYLSEKEFGEVFKMSRKEFFRLTIWKQRDLKKKTELF